MTLIIQKPTGASMRLAKDYAAADPLFSNVLLLLHGNGADDSTTIVDSSRYSNVVTPVGNAQISTEQSKFGGSSIKFDGNGDRLALPASRLWDFDSSNTPVTIELWIRVAQLPPVNNNCRFVTSNIDNNSGLGCSIFSDGRIQMQPLQPGVAVAALYSEQIISVNTWHHVAMVIDSISSSIFIDGVITQSLTAMNSLVRSPSPNQLFIGFDTTAGSNFNFNGYINDLRITAKVGRYTSNFTPPAALLPDFQY
jgi:hypothetical protein